MRKLLLATAIATAMLSCAAAQPVNVNIDVCDYTRGVIKATSCMVGLLRDVIPDLPPSQRIRAQELIAYIYVLGEKLRDKSITEDEARAALTKAWVGS